MTVTYMEYAHTAEAVGANFRLLRIWKGSLLKGVWRDLTLFIVIYTLLSLLYRLVLFQDDYHRQNFEVFCCFCGKFSVRIPLSFLLGFYVTQVVSRWWQQWNALAWPDELALNLTTYLHDRNLRRCVVRWACLSNILVLRTISIKVAKRFPTLEHLVDAQLLTVKEMNMLDTLLERTDGKHDLSWAPIHWAHNVLREARADGLITGDLFLTIIHQNLSNIQKENWRLYCYGWINIPLVYTQLVSIAVYSYFIAALFGRQYLNPQQYEHVDGTMVKSNEPMHSQGVFNIVGYDDSVHDLYIPVFTILEFLFYFGWMKVAESLINPFGEDDDDFETNYIIDRNIKISFMMVEREHVEPEETFCEFEMPPNVLPHTAGSAEIHESGPQMPTDNIIMDEDAMTVVEQDNESLISPDQININLPKSMRERASSILRRRVSTNSALSNRRRIDMINRQDSAPGSSRLSRNNSYGSGYSNIHNMHQIPVNTGSGIIHKDDKHEKLDVIPEMKKKEGQLNVCTNTDDEKPETQAELAAERYLAQLNHNNDSNNSTSLPSDKER